MRGWSQDARNELRVFARRPLFAAIIVATLAVGVGGATAVYSVIRGGVLAPMEFGNADRVVALWGRTPDYPRAPLTVGDFNTLASNIGAFEQVAASWSNSVLLLGGARAEGVSVGWVSPSYFSALGIEPALGRVPVAGEEAHVVLGHDLWAGRYGSDAAVLGRSIDLGGETFEVVGVLPADANANLTGFSGARTNHDLWRLMPAGWIQGDDRSVGWLRPIALLADGVPLGRAQEEVDRHMAAVNEVVTDRDGGTDLRVQLTPARDDLVGRISSTLWILLGAVCGVLLVAAANVAHLMFARGEEREAEVALRAALGGSRPRLMRQFLVESLVLACAGGLAGLGVAHAGVRGLLVWAPPNLPRLGNVVVDGGVLLFAVAATAATVVVFGLVPAVRSTRADLARAMSQRAGTMGVHHQRLSRGLVVVQVALSLTLVTGTGLLLGSLSALNDQDLGFEPANVLTVDLQTPDWGASNEEAAARLLAFTRRLADVPGVESVGVTNRIPLAGGLYTGTFASEAMAADDTEIEASFRVITPGYLETVGARLIEGRLPRVEDGLEAILVDQLVAERAWPGQQALGRTLRIASIGSDPQWAEVVGVIAPMKHAGIGEPATATVFIPMLPRAQQQNFRYVAIRTSTDPLERLEAMREAVGEIDVNAVLARPRTMAAIVDEHMATPRFVTLLLMAFGATALGLAAVGLHGVMAYRMQRRRREMGIRMALGAQPVGILRDAFASGAGLVLVGLAVGAAVTYFGLGPVLQSLLVEVDAGDPLTLVLAAGVILGAGLIGAYLPARMALSVDPVRSLKDG